MLVYLKPKQLSCDKQLNESAKKLYEYYPALTKAHSVQKHNPYGENQAHFEENSERKNTRLNTKNENSLRMKRGKMLRCVK